LGFLNTDHSYYLQIVCNKSSSDEFIENNFRIMQNQFIQNSLRYTLNHVFQKYSRDDNNIELFLLKFVFKCNFHWSVALTYLLLRLVRDN
jgi:hypothetical protein